MKTMNSRSDIHTAGVPVLCEACEARHKGICGGLTPDELVSLSKVTSIRAYPAGTELSSEDEAPDAYANILSGVVKLSKLLSDGRQQIVGLQFAPDFLGRPFAEKNGVTAEAATDVTLCRFPREDLHEMMASSGGLELRLHQQSLKELDDAREWMLTLGRRNATEKVAMFLLQLAKHSDPTRRLSPDQPMPIVVPLSRSDIADFLGLTIETVSRQFTKLRKDGVITEISGRSLMLSSLNNLEELAGY